MSIEIQSTVPTPDAQTTQQGNIAKGVHGYTDEQQAANGVSNAYTKEIEANAAEEKSSQPAKELSKAEIVKVAQQLQEFVKSLNRNVQFSVDENSGRDVISVVEVDTGELIRQIPSEEVLKLASSISKAAGLIVQEKV